MFQAQSLNPRGQTTTIEAANATAALEKAKKVMVAPMVWPSNSEDAKKAAFWAERHVNRIDSK